jgi:hypothetical protein
VKIPYPLDSTIRLSAASATRRNHVKRIHQNDARVRQNFIGARNVCIAMSKHERFAVLAVPGFE